MNKILKACLVLLTLISTAACQPIRTVKVTVVGDDQTPIENAKVVVWFSGYQPHQSKSVEGLTDENGIFEASGEQALLRMLTRINKEGYYETEKDRLKKDQDHDLTLVLRKKKNPISLYAKDIGLRLPVNREWVGYDFEFGDWVKPHGKGKVVDVFFKCDTEMTAARDGKGTLEMKFKEDEGLILVKDKYLPLSQMKMPHNAPLEGYNPVFFREEESFRNKNRQLYVGYFFRTRVVKEGDKIVSANYGKILEDIRFGPRHANLLVKNPKKPYSYATVSFTYYFNPKPNDRNLEFDPSQNLMKGLDVTEKVHQP
ncbi:hypothetical protein P0Y35_18555 [Kiritimatiellaeota bacterium B1221]|nr:hypothetical protein [Kiritimatiellaeota bacterium B1221]